MVNSPGGCLFTIRPSGYASAVSRQLGYLYDRKRSHCNVTGNELKSIFVIAASTKKCWTSGSREQQAYGSDMYLCTDVPYAIRQDRTRVAAF